MGNTEEFRKEFQQLRKWSQMPGAYESVLDKCLSLLERIKESYRDGNNSDPVYIEGKQLSQTLIDKIRGYVKIDDYRKRLGSLSLPYVEIVENNSPQQSQEPISDIQDPIPTSDVEKNQVSKTDETPIEKPQKTNVIKKKYYYAKPDRNYESNPLTDIAISVRRGVWLDELRDKYHEDKYIIRKEDLEKIFGSQMDTLEGMLDTLEEIYDTGIDVLHDPVFMKINHMYNSIIGREDTVEAKENKERREELEARYDVFAEKMDIVGKGMKEIKRNPIVETQEEQKKVDVKPENTQKKIKHRNSAPTRTELRRIEKRLK